MTASESRSNSPRAMAIRSGIIAVWLSHSSIEKTVDIGVGMIVLSDTPVVAARRFKGHDIRGDVSEGRLFS